MSTGFRMTCAASTLLAAAVVAQALVGISNEGRWPDSWPKELELLRKQARTIDVANGTQEMIYEITFTDRAQFESVWPKLLGLRTPGSPLRLYDVGPVQKGSGLNQLESNDTPRVRIYSPSYGGEVPGNPPLIPSPPWPKDLYGPHGELPAFVQEKTVDGQRRWVKADAEWKGGFHFRARIDIDLVIDGKVIDLNRVHLPEQTPIEDHRILK